MSVTSTSVAESHRGEVIFHSLINEGKLVVLAMTIDGLHFLFFLDLELVLQPRIPLKNLLAMLCLYVWQPVSAVGNK